MSASTRRGGQGGGIAGAHAYLMRTFPPYRVGLVVLPVAAVVAAAGWWLRPPAYVVPHPVPNGGPASGPPAQSPPANPPSPANTVALTGDRLTCAQSTNTQAVDAATVAVAACQRVIDNTASGAGQMPAGQAYTGEALADMALGRSSNAYGALRNAITAAPGIAKPLTIRAILDVNVGKYQAAIDDANSALALDGRAVDARLERAVGEVDLGYGQTAFPDADAAVNANPGDIYARLIRGEAEGEMDDWMKSEQDTRPYLSAFPNGVDPLYWHGLAEAHLQGGAPTAIAELTRSAQADLHNSAARKQLGLLAFRNGDWAETLRQESLALAVNPNDAGAYTARSGAEIRLSQFRNAQDDATLAIRKGAGGPMLVAAQQNLGMAAMGQGDYATAVTALQAAHDADPQDNHVAALLDQARRHGH